MQANLSVEWTHLETGLERQLQLTSLDDDVREVQQMDLHIHTE